MILLDKVKYRKVDCHKIQQGSYNAVGKSWGADCPQRSQHKIVEPYPQVCLGHLADGKSLHGGRI